MAIFGQLLQHADPPPPSVKPYALFLLRRSVTRHATALLSNNFHSSASEIEIQVLKSERKPRPIAVAVVAAVLSGLFAGATLIAYKDLAKLCDAAVADQAKFSEFVESVKRRELSIRSTD